MSGWPADQIIKRSLSELSASAHNSRTHSEAQIAKLADAINEWGWTVPVVVDENGQLIAGHGRIMAAERLGISEVPCVVAAGWSEAKKRAYLVADNRIAEMSGWDMNSLISETQFLMDEGFNIDLAGIDEIFLGASLGQYEPMLEPTAAHREITDADIGKTQGNLDKVSVKPENKSLISVMCPHCEKEFEVEGY